MDLKISFPLSVQVGFNITKMHEDNPMAMSIDLGQAPSTCGGVTLVLNPQKFPSGQK